MTVADRLADLVVAALERGRRPTRAVLGFTAYAQLTGELVRRGKLELRRQLAPIWLPISEGMITAEWAVGAGMGDTLYVEDHP